MIEDLKKEIFKLKIEADKTDNVDDLIAIKRNIYTKKIELLDLVQEKDKARAGITAKQLITKVENMPKIPKFETGITKVDVSIGGFGSGLFVNLAGESGTGKTTFLMYLLGNLSLGRKTVFFNFEMGDRLFVKKLKEMKLNDTQLNNLIVDSDTNELNDLLMEIELYAEDGIKFFAIDSKMKIETNRGDNEVQQISNMSKALAKLCARKDITIFLINQMNEDDIKHKRLAFKGSGDQKYDSDIALFLVKEGEQRFLVCTKNRMNDKLFKIPLNLSDYNNAPIITEFQNDNSNSFIEGIL